MARETPLWLILEALRTSVELWGRPETNKIATRWKREIVGEKSRFWQSELWPKIWDLGAQNSNRQSSRAGQQSVSKSRRWWHDKNQIWGGKPEFDK